MVDDQAKAIEAIRDEIRAEYFEPEEVLDYVNRAVEIARALQGSRIGTQAEIDRVRLAVCCPDGCIADRMCPSFSCRAMPVGVPYRAQARAAIAALSPPATPQAPEDVRAKAVAAIDDARAYAFGFPSSEYVVGALDRAHLLATPVTVTMERVEEFCGILGLTEPPYDDIHELMMTYFGIQISEQSEGPK